MKVSIGIFAIVVSIFLLTILFFPDFIPQVSLIVASLVLFEISKELEHRISKLVKYIAICLAFIVMLWILSSVLVPAYILSELWTEKIEKANPVVWYLKLGIESGYLYYEGKTLSYLPVVVGKTYEISPVLAYKLLGASSGEEYDIYLCRASSIKIIGYNWTVTIPELKPSAYGSIDGVGTVICKSPLTKIAFTPFDKNITVVVILHTAYGDKEMLRVTVPIERRYQVTVTEDVYKYIKEIEENPSLLQVKTNNTAFEEAKEIVKETTASALQVNNTSNKLNLMKLYFPMFLLLITAIIVCYYIFEIRKSKLTF